MQMLQDIFLLLLFLDQSLQLLGHNVLMSTHGTIGGGNSTYYTLTRSSKEQPYIIILQTSDGDADLYVSDRTPHPSFEDYELKSETCGEDAIEIPTDFKRPVHIAVYGHPSAEESKYSLMIVTDNTGTSTYDSIVNSLISSQPEEDDSYSQTGEQEESVLWTVFVSILKILFDILVS